jgi:DNA-binding winged helix-turn-helix (wHTH) protein
MSKRIRHFYEFGDFRLDVAERRLLRSGAPVQLPPKAFETLLALVANSGHLLTKEELMRTVWPDAFVEENNLTQYISMLRKAFNGNRQQFIETVPRLGYRFVPLVREIRDENEAEISGENGANSFSENEAETTFAASSVIQETVAPSFIQEKDEGAANPDALKKNRAFRSLFVFKFSTSHIVLSLSIGLLLAFFSLSNRNKSRAPSSDIDSPAMLDQKGASFAKRQSANAEANEAYLKGRFFWNKRTGADFAKALPYFQGAVELDPNFAPGYAGLADCYLLMGGAENTAKAKESVMRALELDETLAEAHASLANIRFFHEWNWTEAEKEFRRAIELDANYATAHHWYAYYFAAMGRMDEAIAEIERAHESDPLSLIINTDEGQLLYFARDYNGAIERFRKTLDMDSHFVMAHCHLAEAYEQKGMAQEMLAESRTCGDATAYWFTRADLTSENISQSLKRSEADGIKNPYFIALPYVRAGDKDQAFAHLNRAFEVRDANLLFLKVDPRLDDLRKDARYAALLQRMNLPL